MKFPKKLSKLKDPLAGAEFFVGAKKVKEARFWKEVANDVHPPKKRQIKIETVKQLLRACPNLEVFGDEIKKYVITKGGRLMLWEDWYKKPHPSISKTEDADFEIIVTKLLPNSEPTVQECDATESDSSNAARKGATSAGPNGAINVWKDDDGNIRCEYQMYMRTMNSKIYKTMNAAIKWTKKYLAKIN